MDIRVRPKATDGNYIPDEGCRRERVLAVAKASGSRCVPRVAAVASRVLQREMAQLLLQDFNVTPISAHSMGTSSEAHEQHRGCENPVVDDPSLI